MSSVRFVSKQIYYMIVMHILKGFSCRFVEHKQFTKILNRNYQNSINVKTQFCMLLVSMQMLGSLKQFLHQKMLSFLMNSIMHQLLMACVYVKLRSSDIYTEIWKVIRFQIKFSSFN